MRPFKWKELVGLCEKEGLVKDRQRGSHYIMIKPGMSRPVVIPTRNDLKEDIVLNVAKQIGLTKKELLSRL